MSGPGPSQPSQPWTTVSSQCSSFLGCPDVWEQIRTPPFADVAVALCKHPRVMVGCIRGGKSGTKRESTGTFTLSVATALRSWTDMMRLTGSPGKEGGRRTRLGSKVGAPGLWALLTVLPAVSDDVYCSPQGHKLCDIIR